MHSTWISESGLKVVYIKQEDLKQKCDER